MARSAAKVNEGASALSDGRRQRSHESRQRIVEAMLDLAREGALSPSADLVAERAKVGRRTVFRLFQDMDSLYREMHAAMWARIEHIRAQPIDGDTWRQRLDCLIERRAHLFEEILPIKTAADTHRHRSAFLQNAHEDGVRLLRQLLHFVLPKTIRADAERFEALDAVLSIDTWRRLRLDQKLSPKAARRVIERMVAAIVD